MDEGEPPLGERPAQDELEVNVAEARIASRLFGVQSEVRVGRYRLLELVGRGGMSVVWGAWDPELERKVAIKLLDSLKSSARDRIVDEARALAKLSHPNVVPVYDVGVVDDRVYLVMEWIAGDNLRVHLHEPRPPREVVALFLQAARGLAAVHAAGLVHRDFKPENAVVGADGRVRVLDFGLALHDVEAPTDVAGTPRYMAPEHVTGGTPTAAVDQYALCVALREALEHGGREVPRWIAAIIARGTAPTPEQRFTSIEDLVVALERDPARVWARRAIAAGVVVATATAFIIGRAAERETCTSNSDAVPADVRARVAAHLDMLGGFAADSRASLLSRLDDHERRLDGAIKGACLSHTRGELSPALYDRRLTCLARAKTSLAATAEILETATATTFPDARVAAGSLLDPAVCAHVDESLVPPPDAAIADGVRTIESEIERARLRATAAKPDAIVLAMGARIAAETMGYKPVLARALLAEGRAQMLADNTNATVALDRAMRVGFAAHDDATAVEAFARLAFVSAQEGSVVDGTTIMRELSNRLGTNGEFARLLLLNNLAVVVLGTSNDPTAARELLETAMASWRPRNGENGYELASIPQNLALVSGDTARSKVLLESARNEVARLVGTDHPKVLEIERLQARFLDLASSRTLLESVCERLHRLFPQLTHEYESCSYEAGWLADQAGDAVGTRAHFSSTRDDDATRALIIRSMIALIDGDLSDSMASELEAAAVARAKEASPWARGIAADAYIAAARIWTTRDQGDRARRCWLEAVAILEAIPRPYTARRLARARTAAGI